MNSSVQVPVGQAWHIESQVETGKEVGSVLSRDVASLTASLEVSKETGFAAHPDARHLRNVGRTPDTPGRRVSLPETSQDQTGQTRALRATCAVL